MEAAVVLGYEVTVADLIAFGALLSSVVALVISLYALHLTESPWIL